MKSPFFKFLLISLLGLLYLAGCTRLEMAVRWADWLIVRETDSYFDLTDTQSQTLKKRVHSDIDRIRRDNFPEFAQLLRKIADQIKSDQITSAQIDLIYEEGLGILTKSMAQFKDTAYDVSLHATTDQIERLVKKYNKKTADLRDDLDTEKARAKQTKKKFEYWTEEWLGSLTDEQEKAIDEFIKLNPFPYELRLRGRETRLKKFLVARQDPSQLKVFFDDFSDSQEPSYLENLKEFQKALRAEVLNLYKSLNSKQKKYLLDRLISRATELEQLASKNL